MTTNEIKNQLIRFGYEDKTDINVFHTPQIITGKIKTPVLRYYRPNPYSKKLKSYITMIEADVVFHIYLNCAIIITTGNGMTESCVFEQDTLNDYDDAWDLICDFIEYRYKRTRH